MKVGARLGPEPVRNGYFGDEKKFELYNASKVRETVEGRGGKSITLPDLADRVLSGNWAGHEFGGVRSRGARWRGDDRRLSCPAVRPPKVAAPFQFFVFLIAGWIHRRQQLAIAYLQAENRVLRERLGTGRLRFTDATNASAAY